MGAERVTPVDDSPDRVPMGVAAEQMNITVRRLQQLGNSGVVPRPDRGMVALLPCLTGYIRYLQTRESQGAKKLTEDARLRGAQADLRLIELQKIRREVIPAPEVQIVLVDVMALLRRRVLAIGARLAGILDGRRASEIKKALDDEAIALLTDVCGGLRQLESSLGGSRRRRRSAAKKKPGSVGGSEPSTPKG